MPESESESAGASSLLSPNTIMAIVTLVGGFFLVSHKLSSQRPARPLSEGTQPLGTQNIESRLWEDPFAAWDKLSAEQRNERTVAGLTQLSDAISRRESADLKSNVLILGVMVSGQPYAEDRESRVRSRYAVGAGLASGGYNPVVADHIGLVASPWPSSTELEHWETSPKAILAITGTNSDAMPGACTAAETTKLQLRVPFEEYEPREFSAWDEYSKRPIDSTIRYSRVFLLWLDEEYFDDEPGARLALFKNALEQSGLAETHVEWAIVGPRYSSTLAALLKSKTTHLANSNLWQQITGKLNAVRLVLATPTAIDEALVSTNEWPDYDFSIPRRPVIQSLKAAGLFESVTNVCLTDKELAREALEELKLRDINPATNSHDHVVLISEWDTLFSRMAALAFASQVSSNPQFIQQSREGTASWPKTLHRFSYLQGLDGEAADGAQEDRNNKEKSGRFVAASVEDLAHWQPDANKAEGAAQFDYLARLGDSLAELDHELWWHEHGSRVKAVGIIGSDVYDTLLILQAMRERLPDAIFFTSDLDARFWHPDELRWTRNLVVVSGYGLQLSDELQAGIAPFRESAQCVHFLATLYALGSQKIATLGPPPPRRFEIGRHGPVEMPVTNRANFKGTSPHREPRGRPNNPAAPIAVAVGMLLICLLAASKPFRRLALPSEEYCRDALRMSEEDLGGEQGVAMLYEQLRGKPAAWQDDELAQWLFPPAERKRLQEVQMSKEARTDTESSSGKRSTDALKGLLERCNTLIFMSADEAPMEAEQLTVIVRQTKLLNPEHQNNLLHNLDEISRNRHKDKKPTAWAARRNYAAVDQILEQLRAAKEREDDPACCARRVALEVFRRRRWRAVLFWLATLFVGTGLGLGVKWAWIQTYGASEGEPFNFQGTSAWPTEFIRFAALALNLVLVFAIQIKLGLGMLNITRRYRLCLKTRECRERSGRTLWHQLWPEDPPVIKGEVDANALWDRYQQTRRWGPRLTRVVVSVLIYFVFAWALFSLGRSPSSPVRGGLLLRLDSALLISSGLSFLFITFWMIDAAAICAWFIGRLSQAPTRYPEATLKYFKHEQAINTDSLVEEWVDLQLIADLTEPIGRVVYWPFVALLLMFIARNPWWDHWTWHWPLVLAFLLNLGLAAGSYVILQQAAKKARNIGVRNLRAKLNQKHLEAARSTAEHEASQVEKLIEEIKNLRRGAFVPFSKNPLIGGLLVNSSGLVLVELLAQLYFK